MANWQKIPENFTLRSREDAITLRRRYYFTGKPCKNGHITPRYVSTGGCLGCLEKWKHLAAINPFSHDLIPFAPPAMWRSKRLSPNDVKDLEKYLQTAIDTFCAHRLPPVCKTCDGTGRLIDDGNWLFCADCRTGQDLCTAAIAAGTI